MDAVSPPDYSLLSKPTSSFFTLHFLPFYFLPIILESLCDMAMENWAPIKGLKESGGILKESEVQTHAKCCFPGMKGSSRMHGCSSHPQVGSH